MIPVNITDKKAKEIIQDALEKHPELYVTSDDVVLAGLKALRENMELEEELKLGACNCPQCLERGYQR